LNWWELTAYEIHTLLQKKEISVREITEALYRRIEQVEKIIHAYVTLTPEIALQKAYEIDQKIARGEKISFLTGIPTAVKDNLCIRGILTTCSSQILENFVPPYNATVVDKLEGVDYICLGKTNMDEFAMGSSTETSAFGITRNPWNLERIPGGSSGGSAAAVAAGEAILALGSDTGGSIRQPASCCGLVGLKPTYGRVSRYGLVAFASSLDQIGPIAKDVRDCALLMNSISGYDPRDSTSVNVEVPDFTAALAEDIRKIKVGVPVEYFVEGIGPEVELAVRKAINHLKELGAEIKEISLPHSEYCLATYYIIAPAEASSNLARFDGVQYGLRFPGSENLLQMYQKTRGKGFGPEVKRRIMLGTYALSAGYYEAYYLKALKVRTLIKRDFDTAFETCDAIVTPTCPTPAFKIGEKIQDPLQMYLSDIFTISVNLTGIPAISIPCGFSREGLPIGLQIMGKPFDEFTILRLAYAYEQTTSFHKQRPEIISELLKTG